ncbi:MAG: hypothetical protein J0H61_08590 [Alphaproteobacteria bacterium]|nr:hypothetical protein [Alphaproteobacteria bacterium]
MSLRRALTLFGALLILSGLFFALQGADIIHWPLQSTMLGRSAWIRNGLIIAAVGVALTWTARKIRS